MLTAAAYVHVATVLPCNTWPHCTGKFYMTSQHTDEVNVSNGLGQPWTKYADSKPIELEIAAPAPLS